MGDPSSSSDPFPPLPASSSVDALGAEAPVTGRPQLGSTLGASVEPPLMTVSSDPPLKAVSGGGACRARVSSFQTQGKLTYHPNVLQDGVVSPPVELLRVGARAWATALSDITEILELRPWHIGDQTLFLRQWSPGMGMDSGSVDVIPLWVQFHGLPMEYWTIEGLSHLSSGIGKPISMDSQTAKMDRIGYAKICIEPSAAVEKKWVATGRRLLARSPRVIQDKDQVSLLNPEIANRDIELTDGLMINSEEGRPEFHRVASGGSEDSLVDGLHITCT
ncbi:hypothetical protein K2173_020228 [Erythroxylum novogranatense]|uniref:DUF4283 domain-containing protein n=1 Tax=Erythroxylum novogranatense TaxID=1862640 RepID=A0AAV8UAL9_9ROSI|nr:hypothetical protein K2173_020228 [Erythroxylum novogranatense]